MRLSGVLWNTEEALVRRGDTVHHVGRRAANLTDSMILHAPVTSITWVCDSQHRR